MNQQEVKITGAFVKKRGVTQSVSGKVPASKLAKLKQKYGARAIDGLTRAQPHQALEHVDWCDALDPHFTKSWLDFIYGCMAGRHILD